MKDITMKNRNSKTRLLLLAIAAVIIASFVTVRNVRIYRENAAKEATRKNEAAEIDRLVKLGFEPPKNLHYWD